MSRNDRPRADAYEEFLRASNEAFSRLLDSQHEAYARFLAGESAVQVVPRRTPARRDSRQPDLFPPGGRYTVRQVDMDAEDERRRRVQRIVDDMIERFPPGAVAAYLRKRGYDPADYGVTDESTARAG